MNLSKKIYEFGLKNDMLIKLSCLLSKHVQYNIYTLPLIKKITLLFSYFEPSVQNKSNFVLFILLFLEQITCQKSIIKYIHLFTDNMWIKCQVTLTGFNLFKFLMFFSEFFEKHPLLKHSYKLPRLSKINNSYLKLFIFDIDLFFPGSMRRFLPDINHYWFEMDFKFSNKYKFPFHTNIDMYTQLFFNHKIIEWAYHYSINK